MKEEIKDAKLIVDFMNSSTNSKLGDKIDKIEDYTESAVNKLIRKVVIMNRSIERVIESCTETLGIIRDEERERNVALDNLIRENKKRVVETFISCGGKMKVGGM